MNLYLSLIGTAKFYKDKRILDYQQIIITNKDTIFDIENDADVMQTPKMMVNVLCYKINQYVQDIEYEPNKLMTYLIANLRSKHNLDGTHDAIFSLFLFRGSIPHISKDIDTNLSNLYWTQKLLFLIIYYAYDFLYGVEIITPYTYANRERLFKYKLIPLFINILFLQEHYSACDILLKLIQDQCINYKLSVKEFIDIERYNLSPCKELFISVFKIFIVKLIEIISLKASKKKIVVSYQPKEIKNFDLKKILDNTLKEYPKYKVFWKNSCESTCLYKGAYINVQNISHLKLIFKNFVENVHSDIKSSTIFLFDIDVTKNVIDYITLSTDMFVSKQTNLSKKIISEIFGFLYGFSDELENLAKVLFQIEKKFLGFMKNNIKSSDIESYLYFSILKFKEDFDILEKCNQVFEQYDKKWQKVYEHKDIFIEIVTMFSYQYTKTITNILKSMDDTVCSYLEISKSDFIQKSNKISKNVLEELANKKIILKTPTKTLASFTKFILNDQQSWYEPHRNTLEKNKKKSFDKFYLYTIKLDHQYKVEMNNNNYKSKYVMDMRMYL